MSYEKWRKVYHSLVSGEKLAKDLETSFLFDLASHAVLNGDFETKKTIYDRFILLHPRVTQDDRARVLIYHYDRDRRAGNYLKALASLLFLQEPSSMIGKAEYWQAIGQCHLVLQGPLFALKAQRKIIALPEFSNLPSDKQLYYLETAIAMKLAAKQIDKELNRYFAIYQKLLKGVPKGVFRKRAEAAFDTIRARAYELQKKFSTAAKLHISSFKKYPDARSKTVSALEYLFCTWKTNPKISSPVVLKMAKFFKAHADSLQPTDITQLQKKYDFVIRKILE